MYEVLTIQKRLMLEYALTHRMEVAEQVKFLSLLAAVF